MHVGADPGCRYRIRGPADAGGAEPKHPGRTAREVDRGKIKRIRGARIRGIAPDCGPSPSLAGNMQGSLSKRGTESLGHHGVPAFVHRGTKIVDLRT